ncbi:hypothetical protein V8E36_006258 [Tilletia maclaganii]
MATAQASADASAKSAHASAGTSASSDTRKRSRAALAAIDWAALAATLPHQPREWQRVVLNELQQIKDVLLVAPTGSGKGYLFSLVTRAWPEKLWIIIVPLKSLEVELATRIGPGAIYINEDKKGKEEFNKLRSGDINAVLISPEMALTTRFLELFNDAAFCKRLGGLIVDEAHVITDWGEKSGFRDKFLHLSELRHRAGVPALAMSGTLPAAYRRNLCRYLELRNLKVMDLGVDRPNICIQIAAMVHPANSFRDLLAFLPELWPATNEAPPTPTIIYINDKTAIHQIFRVLRPLYARAGLGDKLTVFTADSSEEHKALVRPLVRSGDLLCVVATDALGMGSDMSRIRRVIQWGTEGSASSLLQRIGRGGRTPSESAEAVIIVEPWVNGDTDRDVDRQLKLDPDLFSIISDALSGEGCIRKAFNQLMCQPASPPYPPEEIFGVARDIIERFPCCGTCAKLDVPPVPDALLPGIRARLHAWKADQVDSTWKERVRRDPGGAESFLREVDIADIVSNIGRIAHSLRRGPDSPSAFALSHFVASRRRSEVLPEVEAIIKAVLDEFELRAQEAAAAAAVLAREKKKAGEAAKKKREIEQFDAKCRRNYAEAVRKQREGEGGEPRMCDQCRQWNWQHPDDPDPVYPYGHNSESWWSTWTLGPG